MTRSAYSQSLEKDGRAINGCRFTRCSQTAATDRSSMILTAAAHCQALPRPVLWHAGLPIPPATLPTRQAPMAMNTNLLSCRLSRLHPPIHTAATPSKRQAPSLAGTSACSRPSSSSSARVFDSLSPAPALHVFCGPWWHHCCE